jgi:LPXTG-motif cell wall-anchored protein
MLGILAVMLLGASLSFAQTPDNANADRGNGTATTQNTDNNNNRGHDWGWLGLLGLVGLSGLGGRKRREDTTNMGRDENLTNIRRAA